MNILFTGASSFSGTWFVQELIRAGHSVTAIFKSSFSSYQDLRLERIQLNAPYCETVYDCPFGSEAFLKLIKSKKWDLFCHHAADVTNYKSPDFNPISALANNVGDLKAILQTFLQQGCQRVLLTGSVFEQNEGAGSDGLRAVSPYGLSKGLTSEVFRFYCAIFQMKLAKFVIPNPFGPYEEFRFTSFLAKNWIAKKPVLVSMPAYVRDNIHVSLLAKAYSDFASQIDNKPGFVKLNPSGYPESQGAFTARFASELRKRLSLNCEYELGVQKEFDEPKVRLNTDLLDSAKLAWSEEQAWDELATYYKNIYQMACTTCQ
ncbi:Uncharacterized protein PHSC3_000808 [Chlamydiales bacterium STE3]|nr:Uncharacterized protein PHSC3_000808 [Chlamydiales bacterium STE3]